MLIVGSKDFFICLLIFDKIKKLVTFFKDNPNFLKKWTDLWNPQVWEPPAGLFNQKYTFVIFSQNTHSWALGKNSSVTELVQVYVFFKSLPSDSETLPRLRTYDLEKELGNT